jgi:hypothetical protein
MGLIIFNKILSSSSQLASYEDKTFFENLILCPPSQMIFHWSDSLETCEIVKALIEDSETYANELKTCEKALNQLKFIPVWIKTPKKTHQSSMYDLYEEYILHQDNLFDSLDPFCPYEISFLSGMGPFRRLSITECLSESTHREFILLFLMKGKIRAGDFSLKLKSKILMEYGDQYSKADLIDLLQLTSEGIVISLNSDFYTREYSSLKSLRLLINFRILVPVKNKNLDEVSAHLSQYAYHLFYSSSKEDSALFDLSDFIIEAQHDFSGQKKIPLFVSYEKISHTNPLGAKLLKDFVHQTKKMILSQYNQKLESKKAA